MGYLFFASLRVRLIMLVLLAALPALALAIYHSSEQRRIEVSRLRGELQRLAVVEARHKNLLLEGSQHLLYGISEYLKSHGVELEECKAFVEGLVSRNPRYVNIGIATPDGEVIRSAVPSSLAANLRDQQWFQDAVRTGSPVFSGYLMDPLVGEPVCIIAHPMADTAGRRRLVIFASLKLSWLTRYESHLSGDLPEGFTVGKIDESGIVLTHYPPSEHLLGKPWPIPDALARVRQDEEGILEALDTEGIPRLYAFKALSSVWGTGLYMILSVPESVLFAEANRSLAGYLVWIGIVTLLALMTAWFGGDLAVLGPVRAVTQAVQKLADGDLSVRTRVRRGKDELGRLLEAFDGMAATLQHRETERNRAERALRETKEFLEQLTDSLQEGLCVLDARGNYIVDVNPALCRTTLFLREELVGAGTPHPFSPPEQAERIEQIFKRTLSGEIGEFEVTLVRKNAERFAAILAPSVITDKDGNAVGCFATIKEITERKKMEEALGQYSERLKTLHEIDKAILAAQSQGDIVFFALAHIGKLLPCKSASIELLDGETGEGRVIASLTEGQLRTDIAAPPPVEASGKSALPGRGNVASTSDTHGVEDGASQPEMDSTPGTNPQLVIPLDTKGLRIGCLKLGPDAADVFNPEHVEVAREVAASLAVAIQQNRLFEEVKQQSRELRALARRLEEVEENERRRLARELHDRVGQSLTSLGINLNILKNNLSADSAARVRVRLDDSFKLIGEAMETIRDVMADLRPAVLDDYGLLAALRWLGEHLSRRTGMLTVVEGHDLAPALPAAAEISLFRIAQEALINAAKHARASRASVRLEEASGKVRLTVSDDGAGFEHGATRGNAPRWGLLIMQERAAAMGGTLRVESEPGEGTRIIAEVGR